MTAGVVGGVAGLARRTDYRRRHAQSEHCPSSNRRPNPWLDAYRPPHRRLVGVFDLFVGLLRKHDIRAARCGKSSTAWRAAPSVDCWAACSICSFTEALGALFGDKVDLDTMWTPGAAGFTALGLCIGLLIGAAQVILKEAWVKVEAGFRPGRELIVVEGRNRHRPGRVVRRRAYLATTPWNAPTPASCARDDHYLLVDADTLSGTYLNGSRIQGADAAAFRR